MLRGCIKKVLNMQTQHVDQKWGIIVPTTSLPVLPSIFPEFYVRWSLRPPRLHRFELDLNEGKMLERRQVPLKDQWLVNKESIRTCTTQTRHQCVNWIKLYLLIFISIKQPCFSNQLSRCLPIQCTHMSLTQPRGLRRLQGKALLGQNQLNHEQQPKVQFNRNEDR